MEKYLFSILIILQAAFSFATHNRAGEITYRQISDLTYEITVTTFTYTQSPADRPDLEVQWGDNTSTVVPRSEEVYLPNNYKRNKYVGQHTYPGPGIYEIVMEDPNRNFGVINIPNSVNVPFSIKTIMRISSDLGFNNTPILLNPPIDKAAVNRVFIHNPAAYDPDGDSISYKLGICTGEFGQEIPGYTLPESSHSFTINEYTGDLVWDTPVQTGIYNVAIVIEEWRDGIKIGKIIRDMQIEVVESSNNPPVIRPFDEFCVEADSLLQFNVTATDADGDGITLTASGGPLYVTNSPATFPQPKFGIGSVSSDFSWQTNCSHVRDQKYQVTFKAQDNYNSLNLVDIENASIRVICPAPKNLTIAPTNNSMQLSWNKSECNEVAGYHIYRREGMYGYHPGHCQTGVPDYTGYEFIGNAAGWTDTTYYDTNNGAGLRQGFTYCYMVDAYFGDGAESYASEEICSDLVRGIPIITNVSVNNTDAVNGSMYIAWSKPIEFDTVAAPGPYKYLIYRSIGFWGSSLSLIDSLAGINDTIFVDTLINTLDNPYSYKVEFYNDKPGLRFLIGSPQVASSTFLDFKPSDNRLTLTFEKNVPWINSRYDIYRQNSATLQFDSIGYSNDTSYTDTGLANGVSYCYKIKGVGAYSITNIVNPIINFSQRNCGVPRDTIPPCTPVLKVLSNCDSLRNELKWTNPNHFCCDDVIKYNIYYSSLLNVEPVLIATIGSPNDTTYFHNPTESMAGCYYVTAIDSFMNESAKGTKICIDTCTYYKLPNVFSPDGDNINDLFIPSKYRFVEKIEIKIFTRWGNLVFETEDPDINWDGTNVENKRQVSPGVYYYICDVYEHRLTGIEPRTLMGFIHVFSNEETTKP